nr:lectin like protein [uncultured Mediterranean phage uvMED]
MATTIQSGRSSSPLLTADVASRAEVYGGRGLVFDGVADGLQCTSAYIHDKLDSSSNFTSSIWMKPSDISSNEQTIFSQHDRNAISIMQHGSGYLIYINNNVIINGYNNGTFANGVWYHFVVTYDKTNVKVYLNGSLISTTSATYTLASHANNIQYVGSRQNANYFNGTLSDFKLFDSALTEAQVQELYLKPESTPSAVQDNLIWWLAMSEANPDSPQSIVYDHSEKKLGSEELGTWANSDLPWTTLTSSGTTISSAISNGSATMIAVNPFSSVSGSLYKITFNLTLNSGTVPSFSIREGATGTVGDGSSAFGTVSSGLNTHYFQASSTKTLYMFFSVSSATSNFSLADVSIKEVLMGNHATTNFFGDELFDADASTVDSGTHSWVEYAGATMTNDSGAIKVVCSTSNGNGAYLKFADALDLNDDLTVGATYRFSCSVKVDTGDVRLNMSNATGFSYHDVTETSFTTKTMDFVAGHATDTFVYVHRGQNSTIWLDNFSLKEIGISSSGFTTAQNEPTIPQIPLVRYNEKMLFDGIDDAVVTGSNIGISGSPAFTMNCWFILNSYGSYPVFMSTGTATATVAVGHENSLIFRTDNNTVGWGNQVGAHDFANASGTTISLNTLYMATLTYNGSNTIKIYINGILDGTKSDITEGNVNINNSPVYIGKRNTGLFFNGLIDQASVFNSALDSTEIQELFNDGVACDATTHSKSGNLLGYWRNDGVTNWQDRRGWSYLNWDANTEKVQASTTLDGTYTISAWVNLSATGTNSYIVDFRTSSGTGYWLFNTSNPSAFNISSGTSYVNGSTGTTITAGGWNHVVVTGITIDASVAKIGIANDGTYGTWQGGIKSVSIYSGTKSASDVTALFNNGINYNQSSEANLVHYWEMDNGTTVTDLKGNSNGTVTGASLNTGNTGTVAGSPDSITIREGLNSNKDGLGFPFTNPSSNVLRLNGNIGEYIEIPPSLGLFEEHTLEAWFKTTSGTSGIGGEATIISYISNGGGDDDSVMSVSSNKLTWSDFVDDNQSGTSVVNDNKWYHGVVVVTGTKQYIYVDGTLETTTTNTYNIGTTPTHVAIGARANSPSRYFDGLIDEVRIYNKALSLAEIQKNYKHGKGKHKND